MDDKDLPAEAVKAGKRTYRKINIEGQELEFSDGFTDLHTQSYKDILAGGGFGIKDVKKAIDIVSGIRNVRLKSWKKAKVKVKVKYLLTQILQPQPQHPK